MTNEDRKMYARQLLENPVYQELIARLHGNALTIAINAGAEQHDLRAQSCADMRAIKKFNSHCEALASNTGSEAVPVA